MAREITSAKEIALQNESGTPNLYKERLVKLIHSEIIAAYSDETVHPIPGQTEQLFL
jgi:hypothetical protein